ncbi:replication fork protection component Swi3-domain-containing protein [Lenzites betulinus]|nr:replication fork protection component Swi3-domain-containing protein [Lenzites betulinus]
MASLDDIWDIPAEPSSARKPSPAPSTGNGGAGGSSPAPPRRTGSSRPLFFDSDSDNEGQAASTSRYASKTNSKKTDIDAFFDDLDDPETQFQDLAPSLDVDALKRQANAKLALTPHQILPSSSPPRDLGDEESGAKGRAGDRKTRGRDDPVTKRKQRPRLDEARLVGPDGMPALVKQAKDFRPKGKGHELQDLNRLMNVYQFWAHKLYPNTQFSDTVERVEKLCHSKRMNVALSVWRDEAEGIVPGRQIPGEDDPLFSDDDNNSGSDNENANADVPGDAREVPVATDDERSSPARTLPPSSPSSGASSLGALDEDFDIDAMIREDEAVRLAGPPPGTFDAAPAAAGASRYGVPAKPGAGSGAAGDEEEDAAMWDAVMDDFPDEPYVAPARQAQPPPPQEDEDMDEDMWDVVREMEAAPAPAETASAAPPAVPVESGGGEAELVEPGSSSSAGAVVGVDPSRKATNDEGWDEMYA